MHAFPVFLFPHNHLPDRELKRLLSFFGPLTIFQPWLMERPVSSAVMAAEPPWRIVRPPAGLNPGPRLKALLSEVRTWIGERDDKSRMEFIKAVQGRGPSEVSTWEIRQVLREEKQGASAPAGDDILRRHLLLHLAQDIEDQRREADRLLTAAKVHASPLRGALGEEGMNEDALLADLPAFDSDPAPLDDHLGLRLEAWFGLFGQYLKGDEFLITHDPHIMACVSTTRTGRGGAEGPPGRAAVRFRVPDFSAYDMRGLQDRKAALFKNSRAGELRESLLEYRRNASGDLSALARLAAGVEASFPWGAARGALGITVAFHDPAGPAPPSDPVDRLLARHSLILVEAVLLSKR